jgi:hypothetical protein
MSAAKDLDLAQWSNDARRRSMKLFLNAVNKTHDTRNRLWDTEVRMERTADEYHRAILLGADLPPMPIIEVTVNALHLERTADQGE